MRTQIKGLNPNETYCCTKEDVKSFFSDADIKVIFGLYNMSRNERVNSKQYSPYKNCSDRIIARMVVHKRCVRFGLESCSYLSFFILNKEGYSEELRLKFVTEILPKLKEIYEKHKNDEYIEKHGAFNVTIGLKESNFNLYESVF